MHGFTERLSKEKKNTLVTESTGTALVVALVFLFTGRTIFRLLGIVENDFRVDGGIVLLILAITMMIRVGLMGMIRGWKQS